MEGPVIFMCALLILGCGASDSRQTCVDRTEDLRLYCGVGVVYVEGAAALRDCSESVTCCQDTSYGDDVITARVRGWCHGLARCHLEASTWYTAASGGRTSLAVSYICKVGTPKVSGMRISVDKQPKLVVKANILNTTKCYPSYFSQQLCFGDETIEITDATFGQSPCNADRSNCCPDPGDCTFLVLEASPDYYNEILVKCNNKQTCDGLPAQWIDHVYLWCPGAKGTTDYVTLYYMCLTDADRLTTTAAGVTISTTLSTIKPGPGTPVMTVSTTTTPVVATTTTTVVSTATATVVSTAINTTADDVVDNG